MNYRSIISTGISALVLCALVAPTVGPIASATALTNSQARRAAMLRRTALAHDTTLAARYAVKTKTTTTTTTTSPTAPVVTAPVVTEPTAPATNAHWIGAYVTGSAENLTNLTTLEGLVGQKFAVRNFFQNTSQGFTEVQSTAISDHGAIPLITLEFWNPTVSTTAMTGGSYKQIAAGSMDAYLIKYATNAKNFGRPVWFRPFHEMNGDWYPWSGTATGNSPADFIAAWRHVRTIFNNAGATNVKFVWCPNADSVPNTTANAIKSYWPGESYVDYIALDGYNFGTTSSTWRSFTSVMGPGYSAVIALSATKPIFVAETGCGTVGGDKAAWITDMFNVMPTKFSRISGITWFNANKERDWRIESSSASLNAYKAAILKF